MPLPPARGDFCGRRGRDSRDLAFGNHCRLRAIRGMHTFPTVVRSGIDAKIVPIESVAGSASTPATENMPQISRHMRELTGCRPDQSAARRSARPAEPCVLRGLVSDWGITRAGLRSDREAMDYIRSFYNGKTDQRVVRRPRKSRVASSTTRTSPSSISTASAHSWTKCSTQIEAHPGTTSVRRRSTWARRSSIRYLPGFRKDNDLGFAAHGIDPPPAIWIGNRTIASCHYDSPNNIACCVVGRRRFTLFPPEQIFNLYPGPLEPTPGGQAISLVDFANPDFEKFPRFRAALEAGQVADVEPGDAVFIPSMWWHHVQGLSAFNTLVNYWWSHVAGVHSDADEHALSRDLVAARSPGEREARVEAGVRLLRVRPGRPRRRDTFPRRRAAVLGPITDDQARHIRAMLINKLNR